MQDLLNFLANRGAAPPSAVPAAAAHPAAAASQTPAPPPAAAAASAADEITRLCALAGHPEAARGYIEANLSPAQASTLLLEAAAARSDRRPRRS